MVDSIGLFRGLGIVALVAIHGHEIAGEIGEAIGHDGPRRLA